MLDFLKRTKIIGHNGGNTDLPDDPKFPFRLEVSLSPPEFMQFAFICLYGGSEDLTVIGKSERALRRFVRKHDLRNHPRLRTLTISGPNGVIERAP